MFPKHIQKSVIAAATYHEKARRQQAKLEKWIENKYGETAVIDDGIRDAIIDLVEQSNNPIQALKQIEDILVIDFEEN